MAAEESNLSGARQTAAAPNRDYGIPGDWHGTWCNSSTVTL